jgi:glutaredoxin-related protein
VMRRFASGLLIAQILGVGLAGGIADVGPREALAQTATQTTPGTTPGTTPIVPAPRPLEPAPAPTPQVAPAAPSNVPATGDAAVLDSPATLPSAEPGTQPVPGADGTEGPEEMIPLPELDGDVAGDLPVVETTELTVDSATRAIDSYALIKEKYKDAGIEQSDTLQDFVDQNPKGKEFEADIKAAGFLSVNDWNLAITTASFAYTNVMDDQTEDIRQQIEDIKQAPDIPQEMKDRMIGSLNSMVPTANNRTVIETLMKDAAYKEKMKILQVEEE